MKKLNITKEQFNRSGYFKDKYGKLEYVSESGRLFKTDKGRILMFKEAVEPPSPGKVIEKWIRASIKDGTLPGVEKFKVSWENEIKYKGSFMYWAYVLQQIGLDSGRKDLFADESEEYYPTAKYISKVEGWLAKMPEENRASLVLDALDKVYEKGGVFTTANTDHTWLGIPGTEDGKEYVLYKGHEVPKDDIYEYLAEDYPEFSELENDEDDEKWLLAHKKEVTEMLKEMAWAYDESTKKFVKEAGGPEWLNSFKQAQDLVDKACEQLEVVAFEGGADVGNPIHKKLLRIWGEMRDVIESA